MIKIKFAFLTWVLLTLASVATSHNSPGHRRNFGPKLYHRKYEAPSIINNGALSDFSTADPKEIAINFVLTKLHPTSDFVIKNCYESEHNGVTHVYFKQVINGLFVSNGDLNVNVDQFGRVISYGDSFAVPKTTIHEQKSRPSFDNAIDGSQHLLGTSMPVDHVHNVESRPMYYHIKGDVGDIIPPKRALEYFTRFIGEEIAHMENIEYIENDNVISFSNVPFALSDVKMSQSYIQTDDRSLRRVWDIQVEMEDNLYNAHLDAYTGKVISLIDWVSDAAYNVFPFGTNDPSDGDRELIEDPHDVIASPDGWHTQGEENFTNTIGNNVYAQENIGGTPEWKNNNRPNSDESLVFNFSLNMSQPPKTYLNSSVTNLFYWTNMIHDLFYRYGFNEVAGNFQQTNRGKGGKDKDAVIANAQDGSGLNNANFATPPDGQHGKMRMYVWNVTNPWRDGDLESGIIIHEYAHGISTRLTGGPENSNCLGWDEAGGMGEGWGDFFATIQRMNSTFNRTKDFSMGEWANGVGIRKYLYSTSLEVNPSTYSYLNKPGYWGVHAIGEVWAEILYEVYWNLVDKHGFTPNWFPPTDNHPASLAKWYSHKLSPGKLKRPKHGNTLILQFVVDGMKLQPCRPTFINARDAILQADEILTSGDNFCEIWRGFAKRGLA
ncbi:16423_t:CDS:2 [Acaulospora colombiana]|uniref:16423_t:CDS:1 n=1 Tax=Acaulospora colombiana TaxID=27376 RepID=A0ACA9K9J6_9GLOM|nr:16423_t:CDS:2 [Acaulospora colombiana]